MPGEQWAVTVAGAQGLGRKVPDGLSTPFGINQPFRGLSILLQTWRPSILSIFRRTRSGRKEQGWLPSGES